MCRRTQAHNSRKPGCLTDPPHRPLTSEVGVWVHIDVKQMLPGKDVSAVCSLPLARPPAGACTQAACCASTAAAAAWRVAPAVLPPLLLIGGLRRAGTVLRAPAVLQGWRRVMMRRALQWLFMGDMA